MLVWLCDPHPPRPTLWCCKAIMRICPGVCKPVTANKDTTLINAVCPFLPSSQKLDLGSWRPTSNWTNWGRYVAQFTLKAFLYHPRCKRSHSEWLKCTQAQLWSLLLTWNTEPPSLLFLLYRARMLLCTRGGVSWQTTSWRWKRSDWSTKKEHHARLSEKVQKILATERYLVTKQSNISARTFFTYISWFVLRFMNSDVWTSAARWSAKNNLVNWNRKADFRINVKTKK